jgi:hypothetical protein
VNSAAASRAARPSIASSNSSARSLPASRKSSHHDDEEDDDDDDLNDGDDYEGQHYHHDQPYQQQQLQHLRDDPSDRPAYRPRDSVASIKDDPFFHHYQTPQSVSLNREMMTATYEREEDDDSELVSPLSPRPRSAKKPSVDEGVNIPVSGILFLFGIWRGSRVPQGRSHTRKGSYAGRAGYTTYKGDHILWITSGGHTLDNPRSPLISRSQFLI